MEDNEAESMPQATELPVAERKSSSKPAKPQSSAKRLSRKGRAQTLSKLSTQLQFYFSDSNLWKDKFLRQKMAESATGYVAISVIASFKRMQALTKDQQLVAQAARQCAPLLEVSGNGQYIRRATPVSGPPDDLAERTLYIEDLPDGADHDMIKKCFSVFGPVMHVSLPKFKKKGTVKGFAFVEFSESSTAAEAVAYFNDGDQDTATPTCSVAVSTSAKTTQDAECTAVDSGNRHHGVAGSADSGKGSATASNVEVASRKRRHSVSESGDESADAVTDKPALAAGSASKAVTARSKRKHQSAGSGESSEEEKAVKPSAKRADAQPSSRLTAGSAAGNDPEESTADSAEDAAGAATGEDNASKTMEKKKRKRSRSHWRKKSKRRQVENAFGEWKPNVLPKVTWLELKEEYKTLQRLQTNAVKEYYLAHQEALAEFGRARPPPSASALDLDTQSSVTDSECASALDDGAENEAVSREEDAEPSDPSRPTAGFVPFTVIRVEWSVNIKTSAWSPALLKRSLAEIASVRFVEFTAGERSAFVRCASAGDANTLLENFESSRSKDFEREGMCRPKTAKLLSGDEEANYWKMLTDSREKTRSSHTRRCRRGRDRLAGQVKRLSTMESAKKKLSVSNHIVFGDGSEDEDSHDSNAEN